MNAKRGLIGLVLAGTLCLFSGCAVLGKPRDYLDIMRETPAGLKESFGNPYEDKSYWRDLPRGIWDSLFGSRRETYLDFQQLYRIRSA